MRYNRFAVAVVSAIVVLASVLSARPLSLQRSVIEGTWDYAMPGLRGQSMWHDGHYVFFLTQLDSVSDAVGSSDAGQAKLYRALTLQSGTFTVSDTIVTMHPRFEKDLRQAAPASWRWSYSIKGDTITYHYPLDAQGRAANSGRAVRARGGS